jgi:hypothetical protein
MSPKPREVREASRVACVSLVSTKREELVRFPGLEDGDWKSVCPKPPHHMSVGAGFDRDQTDTIDGK